MANEFVVQLQGAEDFDKKVLKAEGTVVVDFWASWCGPCRMLAPILDQVAAEKAGSLTVCKVDVDANPDLAAKFGVMSIPTLLLFQQGKLVNQTVGAMPKASLLKFIEG